VAGTAVVQDVPGGVRIVAGGLGDPGEALVYQDRDYRRSTAL
jgi:hypothetical protein